MVESYGGELPRRADELRKLPGIGDYTAGAIASIAYGEPEPAVDGNVLRVVMRLLACGEDVLAPATREWVSALLREHYPAGADAGRLTEGLMELGETVCIPNGEPACLLCPLREHCIAHAEGRESAFPVRTAKKERRVEERTVLLLRCGDRFAICRREKKGLLAGLWEFPNLDGSLSGEEAVAYLRAQGLAPGNCIPCGEAKHVFSHVEWHMRGYLLDCPETGGAYVWETPEAIRAGYSIPTAFRYYQKILERAARNPAVL